MIRLDINSSWSLRPHHSNQEIPFGIELKEGDFKRFLKFDVSVAKSYLCKSREGKT